MTASRGLLVVAMSLLPVLPQRAVFAACSPTALDAAHTALREAVAPECGTRPLRRIFKRARRRAVTSTTRAAVQCQSFGAARLSVAHNALMKAVAQIGKLSTQGRVQPECAVAYETVLLTLDAALTDAANGVEPTTTTSSTEPPPGASTTTTLPTTCTVITLDVDRSDCTNVTSIPRGLVECSGACTEQNFTVPAVGTLQLQGTPAPGDTSVIFGGDCDDDGTVPLGDASPALDCSLACDCTSF
jgi:hypothetical protein